MVCGVCEGAAPEVKKLDGVAVVLKEYSERRTTDSIYFLILLAAWACMTIIGIVAGKNGDPNLLIAPYSDNGMICGYSDGYEDKPNLFYVSVQMGLGVCRASCPAYADPSTAPNIPPAGADMADPSTDTYICLSWFTEKTASYTPTDFANAIKNDIECWVPASSSPVVYGHFSNPKGQCPCQVMYNSKAIFNRCAQIINLTDVGSTENPTKSDQLKMFLSDLITARNIIFGFGFGIALIAAFVFTYMMSIDCIAWLLVWGCVTGVLVLGIAVVAKGTDIFNQWKMDPANHSQSQLNGLRAFNITFAVLSVCWFLLMCAFYSAINMAIKCVSMGSKALDEMPLMVFIPFLQIGAFCLFLVPWVYYSLFIASDGTFNVNTGTVTFGGSQIEVQTGRTWVPSKDHNITAQLWYMFFILLWTMNFIANTGTIVIAHAVSTWYFTKPENRVEAIGNHNLLSSYKLVFRFHLGTVAFGSLLIALVQYARAIALYIQSKTSDNFKNNTWSKVVCCCMHVCLCCLECCMKFISKNAYIQTAIYGTPFCESAKNSFTMIMNNIMRIGAILVTSEGALFIGKIFTTALATSTSYFYLVNYFSNEDRQIYSPVGPTILVAIISWMTATMFMDVLHMSIDTIFHCFIADSDSNGGVAKFAGDEMTKFVDENGKLSEKQGTHCCGRDDPPVASTGTTGVAMNQK